MIKEELLPALIGFFGAIIGATFSALTNLYLNFRRDKDLRKQPVLAKQLELCLEASAVVAKLATTDSGRTSRAPTGAFWSCSGGRSRWSKTKPYPC